MSLLRRLLIVLPLFVTGAYFLYTADETRDYAEKFDTTGEKPEPAKYYVLNEITYVYRKIPFFSLMVLVGLLPILWTLQKFHERVMRLEAELEALKRTNAINDSDQMRRSEGITLHQQT
jgi:hypothetical protein